MFSIRVNNKKIQFSNFELSDSMEQFVCSYKFKTHDEALTNTLLSNPKSTVEIYYKNEKIKKCYVDTITIEETTNSKSTTVAGRGSLCDLVDSTVYHLNIKKKTRFVDFIKTMVNPFGVNVIDKANITGLLEKVQFDYTTKTLEAITKYSKNFGAILDEDENGNLIINKDDSTVYGRYTKKDFKTVTYKKDYSSLYSNYLIVSADKTALVKDNKIRFRLLAKEADKETDLEKFAQYTADIRKTQSEVLEISDIPGFEFKTRARIKINALIRLTTDRIDSTFRVTGYATTQTPSGIETKLTIKRLDSYHIEKDKDILK